MSDELIDICNALNEDLRKLAQASVTLGKVLYSNVNEMTSVTSSMMTHLERFIACNPDSRKSTPDSINNEPRTPSANLSKSDFRIKQLFPDEKINAPSSIDHRPTSNENIVGKSEKSSNKLLLSMKSKMNDQLIVRNMHRRKPAAGNIIRKLVSLKPNALQPNMVKKPDSKSYINMMVRCKYCPQMLALTHVKYHMYIRHNGPGNYKYKRNPKSKQMSADADLEDDNQMSATETPFDVNEDLNEISHGPYLAAAASSDLPTMVAMNNLAPLNLKPNDGGGTATTTPSSMADYSAASSSLTKGFPQNYTNCSVCGITLHKRRLYEHMRETHDNTGLTYKCNCCHKLYISPIALRTHVIRSPECSAFNKTKRYGSLASYQNKSSTAPHEAASASSVSTPTSVAQTSAPKASTPPTTGGCSADDDVRRHISQYVVRSPASDIAGGNRSTNGGSLFRCQICSESFTTPQGCKVHIFRRHGVKAHTLSSA